MNLDRAMERSRSVNGAKSAATLYNDIEYELALGDPGATPPWQKLYRRLYHAAAAGLGDSRGVCVDLGSCLACP